MVHTLLHIEKWMKLIQNGKMDFGHIVLFGVLFARSKGNKSLWTRRTIHGGRGTAARRSSRVQTRKTTNRYDKGISSSHMIPIGIVFAYCDNYISVLNSEFEWQNTIK